jgi:hypothetical protein
LVVLRDVLLNQRRTFSEIAAADGLRRTLIESGVR